MFNQNNSPGLEAERIRIQVSDHPTPGGQSVLYVEECTVLGALRRRRGVERRLLASQNTLGMLKNSPECSSNTLSGSCAEIIQLVRTANNVRYGVRNILRYVVRMPSSRDVDSRTQVRKCHYTAYWIRNIPCLGPRLKAWYRVAQDPV